MCAKGTGEDFSPPHLPSLTSVRRRRSYLNVCRPSPFYSRAEPYHQPDGVYRRRHHPLPQPRGVVAPPRVRIQPPRRFPRPRSSPGRTSEGNPSSLSPERLRLPRCPGNLSLGLATTASVCRGSIQRVPSSRSFSSDAFSTLFFPWSFFILVFLFSSPILPSLRSAPRPCLALGCCFAPGPTLASPQCFTLLPWFRPRVSRPERERERKDDARWRGNGLVQEEKKQGGIAPATAPLEANRINVSRIIHAYFRAMRKHARTP